MTSPTNRKSFPAAEVCCEAGAVDAITWKWHSDCSLAIAVSRFATERTEIGYSPAVSALTTSNSRVVHYRSFDHLNIDQAKRAMQAIDNELVKVRFNSSEPKSVETAIQQMESMIDQHLGEYDGDPAFGPMILTVKERYRDEIIGSAAKARLEGNVPNDGLRPLGADEQCRSG